jgi:hypothetical protein
MSKVQEYYDLVQNSTYIKNLNTGVIMREDKPQSSLSFNTGQMYNGKAPATGEMAQDNAQSNFSNIKNAL